MQKRNINCSHSFSIITKAALPFLSLCLHQQASDRITHSKTASSAVCSEMLSDMLDVQDQLTPSGWGAGGKHKMKGKMQKHMVQRSNVSEDNVYTTEARKMKKRKL